MKTCDICKRKSTDLASGDLFGIASVTIGTSIDVARVGRTGYLPVEVDLCAECVEKVDRSIAEVLFKK